jgi:hypothetical protein
MADGHEKPRGALAGLRDVGRAAYETYRLGGTMVLAAPLLLLIAVLPEFLQHAAEIHIGMFELRYLRRPAIGLSGPYVER